MAPGKSWTYLVELKRLLGTIYTLDYLSCPLASARFSAFRVSARLATLDLTGASVAEISEVVIYNPATTAIPDV